MTIWVVRVSDDQAGTALSARVVRWARRGVIPPRAAPSEYSSAQVATFLEEARATAGSDDPTRAGLPFNFALGAVEAGHQPQIFLAGEAAYLMKDDVAAAVMPVAMPPLREMLDAVVAKGVPIFV